MSADLEARGAPAPLFTRAFGLLIVAQFLQSLGYASMILLPPYLEHLGASRAEIGVIMGAAAIGALALRPVVAWSLDAVGRKPTLFAGTFVLVGGVAALGLLRGIGPEAILIRAIIGVGIGALFPGYFTFAADYIPARRRTEGLALFGIFGLLGLVVNPVAEWAGVGGGSLRLFFPAVAVIIGASLIPLAFVPEAAHRGTRTARGAFDVRAALGALTATQARPVWWATAVFSGLVAIYMAFATVAATSAGAPWPARIWLGYALGAAVVRIVGARLPDRIGPRNLVAPAIAAYVAALLLAARGADQQTFMVSGLLAGVGHGYCFPVLSSQVVTRMPPSFTGSGMALFTGLWELSTLVLTPIFGVVADRAGDATMFAAAAVFATAGLAIWAVLEATWGADSPPNPASEAG